MTKQDEKTLHRHLDVNGVDIFYREAGSKNAPTIVLLHGFPTSSIMFRNLMPALAKNYHVIAPDLPGYGFSDAPSHEKFDYTFDNITNVIEEFISQIGLDRYALYVFDYGAPVGFRLALRKPEAITAIITQNGNAYLEGVSEAFAPIQKYWTEPSIENRNELRGFLAPETTQWQYEAGVENIDLISPETYTLDAQLMARPGNDEIQLDLFLSYESNVELYPEFQAYFKKHQPPLLAVWGEKDPFFIPPGAESFKKDIPDAEIHFYNTGHFALETHGDEIAETIIEFLNRKIS